MSETRNTFKITMLTHDNELFSKLTQEDNVFGYDFSKSYKKSAGASFSFSHLTVGSNRLTSQYWMLDPDPQWVSVRRLYYRGATGLVLLINPKERNFAPRTERLIMEFVQVNKFETPILILSSGTTDKHAKVTEKFIKNIERWAGYSISSININNTSGAEDSLTMFMNNVHNWSAKNSIYQTLKVYFSIDAISSKERSLSTIVRQLRLIFVARYYSLLSDTEIAELVVDAAVKEGFSYDDQKQDIIYKKVVLDEPRSLKLLSDKDN